MNYKVGDTVVCIDARPYKPFDTETGLIVGNLYKVLEIRRVYFTGEMGVGVHGIDYGKFGFDRLHNPCRFVKLDGLRESEEEQKELANHD